MTSGWLWGAFTRFRDMLFYELLAALELFVKRTILRPCPDGRPKR